MKLPDLPSELINLALNDLEIVEKNHSYVIDMSMYHSFFKSINKCMVCLAGAVMANTLNANYTEHYILPADFDSDTENKLRALNYFRLGDIETGLGLMKKPQIDIQHMRITRYKDNSEKFKHDMRVLSDLFRIKGL